MILKNKNVTGAMMVLAAAIMFSAKAVFIKLAYKHTVDPITLLTLRMVFAIPFYLGVLFYLTKTKKPPPLAKIDYIWIVALGILGYYLASFFDFYGLKFITASLERLILFIYPTLVVLISALVFKKRITPTQTLAIVLTYIGILIIVIDDLKIGDQQNVLLGTFFIFLSALTFAFYLIGSGEIIPKFGSVRFTALGMTISAICVICHYLLTHPLPGLFKLHIEVYGIAVLIAFFCTVIPSFMLSAGIGRIGSSNASVISAIGPVSTIVLAYFLLGEKITLIQLGGTLIVIVAVLMISLKKEQRIYQKK